MTFDLQFLALLKTIVEEVEQCGATRVVVAGGAIRDSLLGKPIKDIDVFYTGTLDNEKVGTAFNVETEKPEECEDYPEEAKFSVSHQKLFYDGCDKPIQFLKVEDIDAYLEEFPCNISKAYIDNTGLKLHWDFVVGVAMKHLSFKEDVEAYATRVSRKYPEYVGGCVQTCLEF